MAVLVYGSYVQNDFHFSFCMCVSSAFLCFSATPFLISDRRTMVKQKRTSPMVGYNGTHQTVSVSHGQEATCPYQPDQTYTMSHPPPYTHVAPYKEKEKEKEKAPPVLKY